jgi:lactate 2-monooxygenase
MYVNGSAGSNSTYRANLRAFEKYSIVPRMLRDATSRNLEVSFALREKYLTLFQCLYQTTLFGVRLPSPLFLAPVGLQGILHADGELATARAAQNVGVPLIVSTASSRSIEQIGKANGNGHRWFQLYW